MQHLPLADKELYEHAVRPRGVVMPAAILTNGVLRIFLLLCNDDLPHNRDENFTKLLPPQSPSSSTKSVTERNDRLHPSLLYCECTVYTVHSEQGTIHITLLHNVSFTVAFKFLENTRPRRPLPVATPCLKSHVTKWVMTRDPPPPSHVASWKPVF